MSAQLLGLLCVFCDERAEIPADEALVFHGLDFSVLIFTHDGCDESCVELTDDMQLLFASAGVQIRTEWGATIDEMRAAGRPLPRVAVGESAALGRHLAALDAPDGFNAFVKGIQL